MTYVVSDLHGIPLRQFQMLLKRARFSDDDILFVLGDTIDRGADGIRLLLWMMEQHNVFHLLGNHEAMLLAVSETILKDCGDVELEDLQDGQLDILSSMLVNGAQPTLSALGELVRGAPEQAEDLLDYLREMPLYDSVEVNDVTYLLVHAGLGNFVPGKKMSSYTQDELLWSRPELDEVYPLGDDVHVVFGHTPTSYYEMTGKIVKTETWSCIDTSDVGPSLLRLDDWSVFCACNEDQEEER